MAVVVVCSHLAHAMHTRVSSEGEYKDKVSPKLGYGKSSGTNLQSK